MAISAATTFEVRTTGSDSNGGGFVTGATGTDFSQQDAAAASGVNLTVDATTNTKVTSAVHNFVAADVGNIIQITAGTGYTTGFYEILSVASNAATLDRSPAAASTTGGTWAMGGAFASPGMASKAISDSGAAGKNVWIKSGTYIMTVNTVNVSSGKVAPTVGGSQANGPQRWRGYQTTRGDCSVGSGTRPTISAGVLTSLNIFSLTSSSVGYCTLENLILDGNGGSSTAGIGNGGSGVGNNFIINCKVVNCTSYCIGVGKADCVVFCEASSTTATSFGFRCDGSGCRLISCYAHDMTGTGFGSNTSGGMIFERCIAIRCSIGFANTSGNNPYQASQCIAYANTGRGFVISVGTNLTSYFLTNCIAYGNGGRGYDTSSNIQTSTRIMNCAGGSNTGGNYDTTYLPDSGNNVSIIGFIALTADPFVNAAGNNFALNNVAGGGALLRAAGLPASFPGLSTSSYPDVGAAQHQDGTKAYAF